MAAAHEGSTVKVHYTGKLASGEVFDTSKERGPVEFKIGEGQILPSFEQAIVGMNPGETKTITLQPDEAFGPHRDDRMIEVPRERIPDETHLEVGQRLQMRSPDGDAVLVAVAEINPETVTLDANHPLAGEELVFDVELLEVS